MAEDIKGRIFNIQRFSIHDGPGIRTTVFLKGCPLSCAWCHNPEGISRANVLSFMPEKCIGCGYCFKACRHGAHMMVASRHVLDRAKCVACGACAEKCYSGALELTGRDASVADVMREVLSDRTFYETSGGGMSLSGGEPLAQIDFTEALLAAARVERIHTCLDTSGYAQFAFIERIMRLVDLFLYDIKDTNDERHKANTGVSTAIIAGNLRALHDAGARIIVRIPLIPGYNDFDDNLRGLVRLLKSLPNLEGAEIMPYHKLGAAKLDRLGMPDVMKRPEPPDSRRMRAWISALKKSGRKILNAPPVDD